MIKAGTKVVFKENFFFKLKPGPNGFPEIGDIGVVTQDQELDGDGKPHPMLRVKFAACKTSVPFFIDELEIVK